MFFGITAMVLMGASWTLYGIVMGKAPKQNLDVSALLFISTLAAAVISLIIGITTGIPNTTGKGILIAAFSLLACGIFNYYQLDIMSKAMQKGPNGIIWSICQSGFIFPFCMGILFFHEPLNPVQGIGFAVIILSLVLFGTCKDNSNISGSWKLLTFTAFLMTGFSQTLQNLPSYFPEAKEISSVWRTFFYSSGMAAGAVTVNLKSPKTALAALKEQLPKKMLWFYVFILEGVEVLVSYFLLFPGMDRLTELKIGAVAFPIMVSSCLITFDLFSLLILREKHKLLQWIALALCIAGVIFLSIK